MDGLHLERIQFNLLEFKQILSKHFMHLKSKHFLVAKQYLSIYNIHMMEKDIKRLRVTLYQTM
jgi:hypothetical protein